MSVMHTAMTGRAERDYVCRMIGPTVCYPHRVMRFEIRLIALGHEGGWLTTAFASAPRSLEDVDANGLGPYPNVLPPLLDRCVSTSTGQSEAAKLL